MKKNIEALWMGRPIISAMPKEEQEGFSLKNREAREAYEKLEKCLDGDSISFLNKYLSLQAELNSLERKNAFVQGFSLGVKLIAEGLED